MFGTGDYLLDSVLLQLLAELALPPPGDVLRTVIGQDLHRRTIAGDPRPQYLQHQRAGRRGVQAVPHQEPAVIVQEPDQV